MTSAVAISQSEGQKGENTNSFSRYQDTSSRHHHHHQNTHQNTATGRRTPSSSRRAGSSSRHNSPQRAPVPVLVQAQQIEDPPQPLYPRQRSENLFLYTLPSLFAISNLFSGIRRSSRNMGIQRGASSTDLSTYEGCGEGSSSKLQMVTNVILLVCSLILIGTGIFCSLQHIQILQQWLKLK